MKPIDLKVLTNQNKEIVISSHLCLSFYVPSSKLKCVVIIFIPIYIHDSPTRCERSILKQ